MARQDARLHRGAVRDGLVRVHLVVQRLAVEKLRKQRAHLRDARGPAHEHDLVHVAFPQAAVAQHPGEDGVLVDRAVLHSTSAAPVRFAAAHFTGEVSLTLT